MIFVRWVQGLRNVTCYLMNIDCCYYPVTQTLQLIFGCLNEFPRQWLDSAPGYLSPTCPSAWLPSWWNSLLINLFPLYFNCNDGYTQLVFMCYIACPINRLRLYIYHHLMSVVELLFWVLGIMMQGLVISVNPIEWVTHGQHLDLKWMVIDVLMILTMFKDEIQTSSSY